MQFNEWLDTFVSEKEIDINTEFTVESNGIIHFVSIGCLIEFIKKTPKNIKKKIQSGLVYLDFHDADIIDYFNHLANGYVKSIGM